MFFNTLFKYSNTTSPKVKVFNQFPLIASIVLCLVLEAIYCSRVEIYVLLHNYCK